MTKYLFFFPYGYSVRELPNDDAAIAVATGEVIACTQVSDTCARVVWRRNPTAAHKAARPSSDQGVKTMKRVYVSGPMTGLPNLNFPAFYAEADRLRALGYEVVNPAEINEGVTDWHACLRNDLRELLTCDAIVLLPNWHGSKGAHLEVHVAHRVGIAVIDADKVTFTPPN